MGYSMIQSAYKSSNHKNMINYCVFINDSVKHKAIIQISHGMCEHIARYDDFAKYLANNGYIVCGNDHLGHGNSIRKYSELGFFGVNGDENLVEDMYTLTKLIQDKFKDLPIIVMGHSMGSFITRCYLDKYSDKIDGCILSGTGNGSSMMPITKKVAKMNMKTFGPFYRSKLVKKLVDSKITVRYKDSHSRKFDWISRDKDVIDKFINDKKCNFIFTLNGYYTLFTLIEKMNTKEWGKNIDKNLPILIFSGTKDPVGGFSKGVKKVYKKITDLKLEDVSLKLYDNGRHEMINEINKYEVYEDILQWLDDRFNCNISQKNKTI